MAERCPRVPEEETGVEASDLPLVTQRAKPEPRPASVQPRGPPSSSLPLRPANGHPRLPVNFHCLGQTVSPARAIRWGSNLAPPQGGWGLESGAGPECRPRREDHQGPSVSRLSVKRRGSERRLRTLHGSPHPVGLTFPTFNSGRHNLRAARAA